MTPAEEQPRWIWHLATEAPHTPACGADKPNQGTTRDPNRVNCPDCLVLLAAKGPTEWRRELTRWHLLAGGYQVTAGQIDALLAEFERLRREALLAQQRVDRMSATPAGQEWDEGFKTGCEMTRGQIQGELEQLREAQRDVISRAIDEWRLEVERAAPGSNLESLADRIVAALAEQPGGRQ